MPLKNQLSACLAFVLLLAGTLLPRAAVAQAPVYQSHWNCTHSGAIALDASGNLYATDVADNCVRVFTSTGVLLRQWGALGEGPGQFAEPRGIVLDGAGNVYVADRYNNRIQVFTSQGVYLTEWTIGLGIHGPSELSSIAVDGAGRVYALNALTGVEVHSGDGVLLCEWRPSFFPLFALTMAVDVEGNVYLSGHDQEVAVYTKDGALLRRWGSLGSGPGQFNQVVGLAVDRNGIVYVADRYNMRIQMFTSSGSYLGQFGSAGSGPGQFGLPYGIACDGDELVFVSDPANDRITLFSHGATDTRSTTWGSVKVQQR